MKAKVTISLEDFDDLRNRCKEQTEEIKNLRLLKLNEFASDCKMTYYLTKHIFNQYGNMGINPGETIEVGVKDRDTIILKRIDLPKVLDSSKYP